MFTDNRPLNDNSRIEKGYLLLSEPFLSDPNFPRSVILVCDHGENGTFGLVVNALSKLKMNESEGFSEIHFPIYSGGPVEPNTLHYLHSDAQIPGAILLQKGLYWSGDFQKVRQKAASGDFRENNCRFFAGYTGWAGGQLQQELESDTWIIVKTDLRHILSLPAKDMWRQILRSLGGKYKMFSNFPLDPRMN